MDDNSGFLTDERDEAALISSTFSRVTILGRSATNIYGSVIRFGKRWFFKGVNPDSPDVDAARDRLIKEFDIQRGLAHPSVANVIGLESIDGIGQCIIFEWIEGETLARIIEKSSLPASARFRIFIQIVEAVSYLHSQGIVHRDLKPDNIMIRKNGQSAVVIDFGLADTDSHIYQKLPAGTEGYASHRQYSAHTPFTGDDIHALGVILQQLCPNLSVIARRCKSGRYPTSEALRLAIVRRDRRRRMTSRLTAIFIVLSALIALLIYTRSLKNRAGALQSNVEAITDSLTAVNRQLIAEKTLRLHSENRQSEIAALKDSLNHRLDIVFAEFSNEPHPAGSDTESICRLIECMERAKADFYANEMNLELTDSELIEFEISYMKHHNKLLQLWSQMLSQLITNSSAD